MTTDAKLPNAQAALPAARRQSTLRRSARWLPVLLLAAPLAYLLPAAGSGSSGPDGAPARASPHPTGPAGGADAAGAGGPAALGPGLVPAPAAVRPAVPTGLRATVDAANVMTLEWTASEPAGGSEVRGYLIDRDYEFLSWTADGTSFVDQTAVPGETYRYQVRAQDVAGANSLRSESVLVTIVEGGVDLVAPTTPVDVMATAVDGRVGLSWKRATDNDRVRGYLVHRDDEFLAWVPPGSATVFVDRTAKPGVTYTYELRAQDRTGNNSEPSVPLVITVPS